MAGNNPSAKTLECPGCRGSIQVRGLGQTCTIACSSCGTIFDITDSKFKLIKALDELPFKPLIPLGTRGKLFDVTYEMIGVLVRTDGTGMYSWTEYLLFNPHHGFRWLVENQGHWSFIESIKDKPTDLMSSITTPIGTSVAIEYEGRNYKKFLSGKACVAGVIGEFYWQVRYGDTTDVADYIAPPYLLSSETSDNEKNWSHGAYLSSREVLKIFPQIREMPDSVGIAPNQVSPYGDAAKLTLLFGFVALCLVFMLQFFFISRAKNQLLLQTSHTVSIADVQKTWTTERFVTAKKSNLAVYSTSNVDNSWVDLELDLIDAKTGLAYESNMEMSYYHGVDSDGRWTEGSTAGRAMFSEVPQGEYYLTIGAETGGNSTAHYYSIEVRSDVPYWGNFWLVFFTIVVCPIVLGIGHLLYENKRWQEADPFGEYS
jgi:Domain of unknown function (DUF4178)